MPTLARKPARGNWIWLGGALCDAVLDTTGSASVLEEIERLRTAAAKPQADQPGQ